MPFPGSGVELTTGEAFGVGDGLAEMEVAGNESAGVWDCAAGKKEAAASKIRDA